MTTETMDRAADVFRTMFVKIADEHAVANRKQDARTRGCFVADAAIFEAAEALHQFRRSLSRADSLLVSIMSEKVIRARIRAWESTGWRKPKEEVR